MLLVLLQNKNSVQLRLLDSGLEVLQARFGGMCTGRGLSCGAFWVITAEGELNRFCRRLSAGNDGSATDLEVQVLIAMDWTQSFH